LSMELLDAMDEEMRSQAGYVKAGYLFVTAEKHNFEQLQRNIAFQQHLGVAVEMIAVEEIKKNYSYLRSEDLSGGSFGSRDGFIDPGSLTNAFYSGALNMDVRMLSQTKVTGLLISNRRISGVATNRGEIEAEVVVDAAGPYAAEVAAWADINLPVQPFRSNIAVTGPTPDLPRRIPMTIDMDTGLLIRREGEGVSYAWTDPDEPPGFNWQFDPDFFEHIAPKIQKRFPKLESAGINFSKCWAGLYPETPDHHALLGESGVSGFMLATGLGGHGIMHAPAVGMAMSEFIAAGKAESVDLSPFSIHRFKSGKLNIEKAKL
ncbi:MAG: NAD(P)/FAD-dependent oxidoreductase, partial [bacterium]